ANANPDARAVISDMHFFGEMTGLCPIDRKFGNLDAERQLRHLLIQKSPNFGPSGFSHRLTHLRIGGYDSTFRSIEDYPMALRFTENNIRIHPPRTPFVRYRLRVGGRSGSDNSLGQAWEMYDECAPRLMKEERLYLLLLHHKIER